MLLVNFAVYGSPQVVIACSGLLSQSLKSDIQVSAKVIKFLVHDVSHLCCGERAPASEEPTCREEQDSDAEDNACADPFVAWNDGVSSSLCYSGGSHDNGYDGTGIHPVVAILLPTQISPSHDRWSRQGLGR